MKNLSGYINIVPFFKVLIPAVTWKKRGGGGKTVEGIDGDLGWGSWDMICCLTVNLYNNQLILHNTVHACINPLPLPAPSYMKVPFLEDDTVQKETFSFSVCVFSRNKVVHVDYFDFKVCLVMPFYFIFYYYYYFRTVQHSRHDVQWLQQYIGHSGLYHTELSVDFSSSWLW